MPIFDTTSLHAAISTALTQSNVGEDKNAFVVVATPNGVKGVLTSKVGEHWQVSQYFSVDHEKHLDGGVEVKATW